MIRDSLLGNKILVLLAVLGLEALALSPRTLAEPVSPKNSGSPKNLLEDPLTNNVHRFYERVIQADLAGIQQLVRENSDFFPKIISYCNKRNTQNPLNMAISMASNSHATAWKSRQVAISLIRSPLATLEDEHGLPAHYALQLGNQELATYLFGLRPDLLDVAGKSGSMRGITPLQFIELPKNKKKFEAFSGKIFKIRTGYIKSLLFAFVFNNSKEAQYLGWENLQRVWEFTPTSDALLIDDVQQNIRFRDLHQDLILSPDNLAYMKSHPVSSPLHAAVFENNELELNRLLHTRAGRALLQVRDMAGYTALELAASFKNRSNFISKLATFDSARIPSSSHVSSLAIAAGHGDVEYVRILMRYKDQLQAQFRGLTALHVAAKYGQLDVVKLLLQTELLHTSDYMGATPLTLAVDSNQLEVVKVLTDTPYFAPEKRIALLLLAAILDHESIAVYLIQKDPGLLNIKIKPGQHLPLPMPILEKIRHLPEMTVLEILSLPEYSGKFKNFVRVAEALQQSSAKPPTSQALYLANSFVGKRAKTFPKKWTVPPQENTNGAGKEGLLGLPLPFEKAKLGKVNQVNPISVKTQQVQGDYLSLSNSLPNPGDRLTLVLAGRRENAYFPPEMKGGRVVLILATAEEEKVAFNLLQENVDVFVIRSMTFQKVPLSDLHVRLFTSRRIAAFELADWLSRNGWNSKPVFAVLDDNIKSIEVSPKLWSKHADASAYWPQFYQMIEEKLLTSDSQHAPFSCLGFKEVRTEDRKREGNPELLISSEDSDFGQKMFFFKLSDVAAVAHLAGGDVVSGSGPAYESLLPPQIGLPQEDVTFQVALRHGGKRVGKVDRNSVVFNRVKGGSFAKTVSNPAKKWKKIDFKNENLFRTTFLKNVIDRVDLGIQSKRNELIRQNNQELNHYSSTKNSSNSRKRKFADKPPSDKKYESQLKKQMVEKAQTQKPPKAIEYTYALGTLEPQQNWDEVAKSFSSDLSPALWDYQQKAIKTLSKFMSDKKKVGYFDMATGTGKTFLFSELFRLLSQNLSGNRVLVLPNLAIKEQVKDNIIAWLRKVVENNPDLRRTAHKMADSLIVISSEDEHGARQAALNVPLKKDRGRILIFCEKSFEKFIEHRKGDLSDVSAIAIDEMHKIQPSTGRHLKALGQLNQGLILGFSATPQTKVEFFGGKEGRIFRYGTTQAVRDKRLVSWETVHIKLSETITHDRELLKILPEVLPRFLKNQNLPGQAKSLGNSQGIIYINGTTEDADRIAGALNQAGIPSSSFHYKTDRLKALESFKRGEIRAMVAIRNLREGFDDPNIDYVIMAQHNPSQHDIIQMRGRALRLNNNPSKIALIATFSEAAAKRASQDKKFSTFHPVYVQTQPADESNSEQELDAKQFGVEIESDMKIDQLAEKLAAEIASEIEVDQLAEKLAAEINSEMEIDQLAKELAAEIDSEMKIDQLAKKLAAEFDMEI
jgi:superfamily II DNA or RNA helicase